MVSFGPIRMDTALTTSHFRRPQRGFCRPAGPAPLFCGPPIPALPDAQDHPKDARHCPCRGHADRTRPGVVTIAGPRPCPCPSAPPTSTLPPTNSPPRSTPASRAAPQSAHKKSARTFAPRTHAVARSTPTARAGAAPGGTRAPQTVHCDAALRCAAHAWGIARYRGRGPDLGGSGHPPRDPRWDGARMGCVRGGHDAWACGAGSARCVGGSPGCVRDTESRLGAQRVRGWPRRRGRWERANAAGGGIRPPARRRRIRRAPSTLR